MSDEQHDLTAAAKAIADRVMGGSERDCVSVTISAVLERDPHAFAEPDALTEYARAATGNG